MASKTMIQTSTNVLLRADLLRMIISLLPSKENSKIAVDINDVEVLGAFRVSDLILGTLPTSRRICHASFL